MLLSAPCCRRMRRGDELFQRFTAGCRAAQGFRTLPVAGEGPFRSFPIAVYLPAADALVPGMRTVDEALYVLRRVAEEEPHFMREAVRLSKLPNKLTQTEPRVARVIPALPQNGRRGRVEKILLQRVRTVQIDQGAPLHAAEKNGPKPVLREKGIQLEQLAGERFAVCILGGKHAACLDARQRRRAVSGYCLIGNGKHLPKG